MWRIELEFAFKPMAEKGNCNLSDEHNNKAPKRAILRWKL